MSQIVLDYPSHLRIEAVQGCTRSCITCPASPNKKDHKLLSLEVFTEYILPNITDKVKRIEFSMHGEPLLNPNLEEFIRLIKCKVPKVQVSIISNGDLISELRLLYLFRAGLNFIHVDVYAPKAKKKFMETIKNCRDTLNKLGVQTLRFAKGGINIWGYHGGKNKTILLSDESKGFNAVESHTIRNIHTWAGNLPYDRWPIFNIELSDFPMNKKCTEPMKCAPIDIYGNVTLCCADFNKSIVYGSLREHSMHKIWNGEKINKVRFLLSKGLRKCIPACFFCNRPSFRVGLWPYVGPEYDELTLCDELFLESSISNNLLDLLRRHSELNE